MRIIITGGSGLIGRALTNSFSQDGHEILILSRNPERVNDLPSGARAVKWDGKTPNGWGELIGGASAVINLAGENIAGEGFFPDRWTDERKRRIRDSRLNAGKAVTQAIQAAEHKPGVVVQASAIGYYGPSDDQVITEDNPPGDDFMAEVCQEWENSTAVVEKLGVRRVVTRGSIALSTEGGAFTRLLLPFKLYAGGPLGRIRQEFGTGDGTTFVYTGTGVCLPYHVWGGCHSSCGWTASTTQTIARTGVPVPISTTGTGST